MSSNDTFQDYKVKHLFLLVGENPLPNYVAAMKLLENGGTVYLVYTNQTKSQKERLKTALKEIFKSKDVDLTDNKSNAYRIYKKVCDNAKQVPTNERIGLHYTGGTNTMAVHAYRAIADLQRTDTVYSYLDAKTLEIFIDNPNSDSTHRAVQLIVPLEVLFKLHKYEWQEDKKPLADPILPEAAAEFVRLYQNEKEIANTWRSWCKTTLDKKAKNSEGWWVDDETTLSLVGVHQDIIKVFQKEEYKHFFAINGKHMQVKKNKNLDNLSKLYAWLSGCWLEHYVLSQIQEIARDEKFKHLQIGDSKMSFVIKRTQTWEGGVFEFDVAFMRSYQLFAISCTTSADHTLCKLKLFEAYIRARQLGGDEARVALVCCCDDDTSKSPRLDRYLKSQLEGAVTNPKIAVFIRQDLPSLKEKIAYWVEQNKGAS